ncbi:hypothetical protein DFH08DRAFT_1031297 [Mycena albidolilacea]|uniref:Uncharacterized protein n=1 Tax=Mycena albidolilacea TaxID=1033008 RepID=A0AAD7EZD3_9AGAR|nr:hypothetical protein DFH08DRAFT_1031297 [Mycena albidolilacea]
MSDRLNELRTRSADKAKLKSWFSYAKTKDNARKVEPFRAWLTGLKSIHGAPHRLQIAWIIWQHPAHGDSIRLCYKETYKKDVDKDHEEEDAEGLDAFVKDGSEGQEDMDEPTRTGLLHRKHQLTRAYFAELSEEEKAEVLQRREAEFAERHAAYERLLKGEAASSVGELANRRRHAEAISHRVLESLCAQLQCKGVLILGEIVEGTSEGADGGDSEIFVSMVQHGSMPKHPNIDFATWAPAHSKAVVQAFADFVVACKKEEQGLLGNLCDPMPSLAGPPALCSQCLGSLLPLPASGPPAPPPAVPAAVQTKAAGRTLPPPTVAASRADGGAAQKAGKRKAKGKRRAVEAEAVESDAGDDDEDNAWSGGGGTDDELADDPFADEEDSSPRTPAGSPPPPVLLKYVPNSELQAVLNAMDPPQRRQRILELNSFTTYEFKREKNVARNKALFHSIFTEDPVSMLGISCPKRKRGEQSQGPAEPTRSSGRLTALATTGADGAGGESLTAAHSSYGQNNQLTAGGCHRA